MPLKRLGAVDGVVKLVSCLNGELKLDLLILKDKPFVDFSRHLVIIWLRDLFSLTQIPLGVWWRPEVELDGSEEATTSSFYKLAGDLELSESRQLRDRPATASASFAGALSGRYDHFRRSLVHRRSTTRQLCSISPSAARRVVVGTVEWNSTELSFESKPLTGYS